jgi:hypothetical protein
MKKTYHTTEQIIRILREAETGGQSHEAICREHNISSQTFYRWKVSSLEVLCCNYCDVTVWDMSINRIDI